MTEITPAARRIARTVNEDYGYFHAIYFSAEGDVVARRVGPGDFGPSGDSYRYHILPTKLGPQPQRWTWREVQDALDEQDGERESNG
jgi:hypothetical protein